jgi:hypothetical protein
MRFWVRFSMGANFQDITAFFVFSVVGDISVDSKVTMVISSILRICRLVFEFACVH